uniref:Uncharacterized protein n=1 Tax=Glossina austeni TaxID=7395 RepID=A0A1A9VSJ0_GLOAU
MNVWDKLLNVDNYNTTTVELTLVNHILADVMLRVPSVDSNLPTNLMSLYIENELIKAHANFNHKRERTQKRTQRKASLQAPEEFVCLLCLFPQAYDSGLRICIASYVGVKTAEA